MVLTRAPTAARHVSALDVKLMHYIEITFITKSLSILVLSETWRTGEEEMIAQ